ncbi:ATP-binding cassette domain-containing protein [Actinomadura luteofluorescens]|uniref:ATP-binding cassette domain-containing protein n=1 Tax=Actinomadura luteofluorescens TaxID=46163 RepID=UPI0036276EA7
MVGAVVIVGLPEVLRTVQEYRGLFFALLLIAIVLLRPQGVWPYRPRRLRLPARPGPAPEPAAARDTVLEVDGLTRRFGGVTAVDGLALRADASQVVSVIGPNGAGKTTAFNCVTGMIAPSAGTVVLAGRDVRGLPRTGSPPPASRARSRASGCSRR